MGGHRVLDIICMMIYANLLHGMPDPWGAGISAAEDGRIRFLVILIKKAVRTETQQRPVLETNTFLYKQIRFLSWNRTNTKKTQTWDFKVLLLLTHIYIIQPAACSTAKLVRQVKDLSAIWLVFSNVVSAVHFLLSLAIVLGFFFPSQAWHWPNVERLRLRLNVFSQ